MAVDLAHQGLLVVATLAVAAAMLRPASLVAPSGLDRILALITLTATTAVLSVLLGLAGLGDSPIALATAALGVLALSRLLPVPQLGLGAELLAWQRSTPSRRWLWIGGLVGAGVGWIM